MTSTPLTSNATLRYLRKSKLLSNAPLTQLYFNQPQFVENCSITRGKIKNSFIVNGTLITEPTFSITGHEGIIRSRSLFDKIQSWIL
ncbi:unnamed protein product [Caenorhabditis nigoni]